MKLDKRKAVRNGVQREPCFCWSLFGGRTVLWVLTVCLFLCISIPFSNFRLSVRTNLSSVKPGMHEHGVLTSPAMNRRTKTKPVSAKTVQLETDVHDEDEKKESENIYRHDRPKNVQTNSEGIHQDTKSPSTKKQEYQSCIDIARKHPEPYTEGYRNQKIEKQSDMYAFYRWDEKIEMKHMDAQKAIDEIHDCRVMFKVKNRQLFVFPYGRCYNAVSSEKQTAVTDRYGYAVELLLLVLEVYDVPDVDFVMELEDADSVPKQLEGTFPVLCYSIKADPSQAKGFTFPSFGAYSNALGIQQLDILRRCLRTRYPHTKRIAKAVWRGTTTGSVIHSEADARASRRIALAQLSMRNPEVLNSGIVNYVQVDENDAEVMKALRELAPLQEYLTFEHFNAFEAVIDVDGNAWSDRFFRLLASNTPILKQEYEWMEYFGHMIEDRKHVTFFKQDLSDLISKAKAILTPDNQTQYQLELQLHHCSQFAEEHLTHLGVFRAMAYALTKYAESLTWEVKIEDGYIHIPRNTCCHHNPSLPLQLIERMNSLNPGSLDRV